MSLPIPTSLIERALALTSTPMEEMYDYKNQHTEVTYGEFSMKHFCYYLLSPPFIMAYNRKMIDIYEKQFWGADFGGAIAEYQSGNSTPLISLLEKIPGSTGK